MSYVYSILGNRAILKLLLFINVVGTIYGYYWYIPQLEDTPAKFLLFVPDSPTASLFFCFVLVAFLLKKNWPWMEALALVTLVKYGIWAVVMNILVFVVQGEIDLLSLMLLISHALMAVQAILYAPFYRMKAYHLIGAAVWTLHNDVIDYVFLMHPRYPTLNDYVLQIGYFTFWLSIFCIGLAYLLTIYKKSWKFTLK